jgi:segregation and condensation protein A
MPEEMQPNEESPPENGAGGAAPVGAPEAVVAAAPSMPVEVIRAGDAVLPEPSPMQELLVNPTDDVRVRLPVFEGPLDLLLFLIRKNEIDIHDIPIESVTRQYLEVLRGYERLRLEVAGEFFVMAATLMEIKSRMLLPKDLQAGREEAEEEGADPRWELVHQLLQYKKFKEAAGDLETMIRLRQDLIPRVTQGPEETPVEERPLQPTDRIELWTLFNQVLRRLADRLVVGEIHDEQVTIVDQMERVLNRLRGGKTFEFTELFPDKTTLYTVVVTFLAVLELARLKKLQVRQEGAFGDVLCVPYEAEPAAVADALIPTGGEAEASLQADKPEA